jgi:RNA polymerase sigma-70 factor (ECF subfamily)
MSAESFLAVLAEARGGNESAIRELLTEYEPEIRRLVRVRLANNGLRREFDSVDVCQSVMADFFQKLRSGRYTIDSPEQLIALLSTIAKKNFLKRVRRINTLKRGGGRRAADDVADLDVPEDADTPSAIVAQEELCEQVMAHLSPDERIIARRRAEGFSWQDIADELGGTADQLRVRYNRAIARVRAEMGLNNDGYD